ERLLVQLQNRAHRPGARECPSVPQGQSRHPPERRHGVTEGPRSDQARTRKWSGRRRCCRPCSSSRAFGPEIRSRHGAPRPINPAVNVCAGDLVVGVLLLQNKGLHWLGPRRRRLLTLSRLTGALWGPQLRFWSRPPVPHVPNEMVGISSGIGGFWPRPAQYGFKRARAMPAAARYHEDGIYSWSNTIPGRK